MMGQPTETTDLSSQGLMDTGPTVREPAWNRPRIGPLHVCDNPVAWYLSKASNVREGSIAGI